MRKRTTTVALLAAFTVAGAALAPAAFADGGEGDTEITKVVVNGGKSVVVGAATVKKFTVSVTATDDQGIDSAEIDLIGPNSGLLITSAVKCVVSSTSATTSTCSAAFTVDPRVYDVINGEAGTWYVDALVNAKGDDSNYVWKEKAGSFKVQRASQVTVNAAPEPVKKGKTITVTGKLTRANWETGKNVALANQSVALQFRKAGTTTYTNVKGIKSTSTGALKTTVKASVDGFYRYSYAGITTTAGVSAAGDYIDVK
ncbi:calcium-binding protein [Streptomyces sp. NBC_00038]|uniref:calcium-binding protein n=1 Tax=Streptomyces sp. NBC_00038 TaxID=2903615 RepID=UPI00224E4634|nr:calcium-binding protein [Streptomyces sp. NBC_00038]MCX5558621.1 calcium-binding protein [Streptomyces sp. NBC_00038]